MYRTVQSVRFSRRFQKVCAFSIVLIAVLLFLVNTNLHAQSLRTEGPPVISAGAEANAQSSNSVVSKLSVSGKDILPLISSAVKVDKDFESMGFDDNPVENINPSTGNGVRFIPPDPIGAAGNSRLVAVVNSMIEVRTKSGQFKWREGLRDFFAPLSPTTFPFDPKVVYDHFEQRFVVVALEQVTGTASVSPTNISRILLAVSKNGTPKNASDWRFHAIDSKTLIPRPTTLFDHWADYPGFEVDKKAIYITANMFTFVPFGSFGGSRLWIVDKGVNNGFYKGGAASVNIYDAYGASGGIATTTMPAQVFGPDAGGSGIGTYLVSYSGLSDGVDEYVQVVRVDDPLGTPTFSTAEFINIGNIESFSPSSLPDAPQPGLDLTGTARTIEVNDRRALDCVWRDDALWLVTTINPISGTDAGQTTAHWWKLNTSAVPAGAITMDDQGDIGGEDIATGTFTYFPSVAVNGNGHAAFGFSASAPTLYAGAYVTARADDDPAGTVRDAEAVHEGEDFYFRTFSTVATARNRWGDYSGISVDPSNGNLFWVYNEFADERGSILASLPTQDGRWGTAWGRMNFSPGGDSPVQSFTSMNTGAVAEALPTSFGLAQNHPNPFNPETIINYQLPEESSVAIKIYNIQGQLVRTLADETKSAGFYTLVWDGRDAKGLVSPTGTYFYQIKAGNFSQTRKMVLLK